MNPRTSQPDHLFKLFGSVLLDILERSGPPGNLRRRRDQEPGRTINSVRPSDSTRRRSPTASATQPSVGA